MLILPLGTCIEIISGTVLILSLGITNDRATGRVGLYF